MKGTLAIIAISAVLLSGLIFIPGVNNSAYSLSFTQSQVIPADLTLNMGGSLIPVADGATPIGAHVKSVTFVAVEKNLTLPTGQKVSALTFNGTIPGPTVRVTQGDVLKVTIINPKESKLIHSIDHHASIISAVPNFGPVPIGGSKTYTFVAGQPGFFKYHCEGNGVLGMDQHVFSGMVGGVIVDPKSGYTGFTDVQPDNATGQIKNVTVSPMAKEVTFQFSEYYLNPDGSYDQSEMFKHNPTAAWINGIPFGYDPVITKTPNATTLFFKVGDHVRFFVINHGNFPVNFHIVGEQLHRVTDGSVVSGIGKQTYTVGGSNDAIFDVVFTQPGVFAFVNHDYAQLFKGQAGLIVVDGPDNGTSKKLGLKDDSNPSNAIPPMGVDSIPVKVKNYTLGTPLVWNGQGPLPKS